MRNRQILQYTIRGIPREVDRRLRDNARRLHRSLNRALVDILARAAGAPETAATHRDLDSFFGSWTADPKVDKALAEQRTIDPGLWR